MSTESNRAPYLSVVSSIANHFKCCVNSSTNNTTNNTTNTTTINIHHNNSNTPNSITKSVSNESIDIEVQGDDRIEEVEDLNEDLNEDEIALSEELDKYENEEITLSEAVNSNNEPDKV